METQLWCYAAQHSFRRTALLPSRESNGNLIVVLCGTVGIVSGVRHYCHLWRAMETQLWCYAAQHSFRHAALLPSRESNGNSIVVLYGAV